MKKNFLEYSLEQLLDEKSFISWVLHNEHDAEWEQFLENNPAFRPKADKAREIILLLRDKHDVLDENSVLELWEKIKKYNFQYAQKQQKQIFRRRLSWAASILVIVSLGTFGYFFLHEREKDYQFTSSEEVSGDEARMVLSTGEEIALLNDNSTISVNDSANQVMVNDSLIDLTRKSADGDQEVHMNEVVIPYGKKSELLLADGTKVWLNAGSRLAFPSKFTENIRKVFLEGEAYFQVARNKEQPFIVKTGEINVRVLGTHFNVSAYPAEKNIETVLLKGSVAVKKPKTFGLKKDQVILSPNQKASFNKKQSKLTVTEEPDVDLYIAWTYGWLKYNRESLSSVFRKVERYYNVKIHLPVNYPGDDRISGKLDLKDSLEEVMMVLADASGIDYRITKNEVFIEKKMQELHRR